ncbi:alpha/beta family hydrolase [Novosphingobium sp.]|uniref:alpha/beta family hydrolase n=1 Tax=Novosphingobium sp. TaxID=1874826 RepID=UPI0035B250F5
MPHSPLQTTIGSVPISHLGPLDAARLVVIVGRSNHRKQSALLDTLALALHEQQGLSLCWFASRRSETLRMLDLAFDRRFGLALGNWCEHGGIAGRLLRKLLYAALLLARPRHWDFFPALLRFTNAGSARDLRRFLGRLRAREFVLLGHSAGGIVASLAAREPRVSHIACVGYPFRHPDQAEDPARTAHLADLAKPMLILQGRQDPYGAPADALGYRLSRRITIIPLTADHDYLDLSQPDLRACFEALARFVRPEAQTGQACPELTAAAILRSRP